MVLPPHNSSFLVRVVVFKSSAPQKFSKNCGQSGYIALHLFSSIVEEKSQTMKGEMFMNSIQVRIDYDTKLQLMRDAEANKLTLSTLMRRLINLYLTDESVRQKVQ